MKDVKFSLRDLLWLTLLIAVVLGWRHDRNKTAEVRQILSENTWFISHKKHPANRYFDVSVVLKSEDEVNVIRNWIDN